MSLSNTTTDTGNVPLVIDEFVITPEPMPRRYKAHLAIRYGDDQYVQAIVIAHDFLRTRYGHVVPTGTSGSPNGDRITVWFQSSGPVEAR